MSNKQSITDHLSDDLLFITICCQTDLSEEDIAFLHTYLDSEHFSLKTLMDLANQHGILPLVYKALKNIFKDSSSLHDTLLDDLKSFYMQIVRKNMLMSAELIRIMKLLKTNSMEALAFKGPTLSKIAYGEITLRQYSDLDILIKENHKNQIRKILESEGYKTRFTLSDTQEQTWYKYAKDISLFHPKKGIYLELHWLLLDKDYPIQVNLDNIWSQPQTVDLNGQAIQTFSAQSLLFYLTIHGSKHLWERIEWIKDIDLIIRTQSIDWESITNELGHSHFQRMFLLGVYLSHTFFKTPLPDQLIEQMEHQKWLIKLSDFIVRDWQERQNMLHHSLAMIYLFPGIKMKLLYLFKIVLKPSRNEYEFVDLPNQLYWVYYLFRPYLLIKKYLKKG